MQPHYKPPLDLKVIFELDILFYCFYCRFRQASQAVSQTRCRHTITMQTIRQLLWINTKATSENLIISFNKRFLK